RSSELVVSLVYLIENSPNYDFTSRHKIDSFLKSKKPHYTEKKFRPLGRRLKPLGSGAAKSPPRQELALVHSRRLRGDFLAILAGHIQLTSTRKATRKTRYLPRTKNTQLWL